MFLPPCQRLRHSLFVFIFLFYTPVKIFLNHFLHTKVPSATLILKKLYFVDIFLTSHISLILLHTKYFKVKIQNVFFCANSPIEIIMNYNSLGYNSFLHKEIKMYTLSGNVPPYLTVHCYNCSRQYSQLPI